jgi:hypothetical protein
MTDALCDQYHFPIAAILFLVASLRVTHLSLH